MISEGESMMAEKLDVAAATVAVRSHLIYAQEVGRGYNFSKSTISDLIPSAKVYLLKEWFSTSGSQPLWGGHTPAILHSRYLH